MVGGMHRQVNESRGVGVCFERVVGVTSPFHSSYEKGCQGKKLLPAPLRDAGVVTCIQPHLIPRLILHP